jgi:glycerophosphoryl diester phosphodiesterase
MPGWSGKTPAFIQKAIETGAEMIEFDVWRTSDGIIAVHHDPDVSFENEKPTSAIFAMSGSIP